MINRIDHPFVSDYFNNKIDKTKEIPGKTFFISFFVIGAIILIAAIVIGSLFVNYYKDSLKWDTSGVRRIRLQNYDFDMYSMGAMLVATSIISGPAGGALFGGIFCGIACGVATRKIAGYRALLETFRHGNNPALDENQLRRFFDMAPPEMRPEIWNRCHTKNELRIFIEKFGKDLAYDFARRDEAEIIAFIDNPAQAFDFTSLRNPKKEWFFYEYAKTKSLNHRLQIARELFENIGFNEKDPEVFDFTEFARTANPIDLELGRWGKASSFLLPKIDRHLIQAPLKSLKEKLQFSFEIIYGPLEAINKVLAAISQGRKPETEEELELLRRANNLQTINKLLAAIFDGRIIQEGEERSLLNCAKHYMDGFYDQALAPLLKENEV